MKEICYRNCLSQSVGAYFLMHYVLCNDVAAVLLFKRVLLGSIYEYLLSCDILTALVGKLVVCL